MINKGFKYTLLITSLPPHPRELFTMKQPPLSRIQLNRRLTLLDEQDATNLENIETLIHWSEVPDLSDSEFVRQGELLLKSITNDFVKQLLIWRLQIRTLMTALRKRHQGLENVDKENLIGFGNYLRQIHQHWQEQDFNLSYLEPWLSEANNLLITNKSLELEKLLLNRVWQHYQRLGQNHYFDFEAVVIYVLRWNIIHRWHSYNKEQAITRFDELVTAGLVNL